MYQSSYELRRLTMFIQGTTEQNRYWGPLLSDQQWHHALKQNNFSGAGICLRDYQDQRHTFSTIISTALETQTVSIELPRTIIVIADDSEIQSEIAHRTSLEFQTHGISTCELVSFQDLHSHDLKQKFCIFLLEIDGAFVYKVQEKGFAAFKTAVLSANAILWLTRGGGESAVRPEVGLITGLGRSLRTENIDIDFVELALEEQSSTTEVAHYILKVFKQTLITLSERNESEFMEKDGRLCINRVVEANYLNDRINSKVALQKAEMQSLRQVPERSLTLTIGSPGLLDTLRFVDDRSVQQPLETDEVEIEVKATGVNFKDLMIAMGQIPGNTLGLECSGIITRLSDRLSRANLQRGDRVCCLTRGAYGTRVRTYSTAVSKDPG